MQAACQVRNRAGGRQRDHRRFGQAAVILHAAAAVGKTAARQWRKQVRHLARNGRQAGAACGIQSWARLQQGQWLAVLALVIALLPLALICRTRCRAGR